MSLAFGYDLTPTIKEINVTGDFLFVAGDDITTDGISVPSDVAYKITSINWYESGSPITEGKLTLGDYTLEINLAPSTSEKYFDIRNIYVNGDNVNLLERIE